MLIEGKLPNEYSKYTDIIKNYFFDIHGDDSTVSKHYWIDKIDNSKIKNALDVLRNADVIKETIQKAYPKYKIESVHNSDEVYISVDPSLRKNSDIALSDCHYDAPFKYVYQCGNVFIRVILGITENSTTYTTIEDKVSLLSTLDFNGMDYNNDYHCVKGYIPKGQNRILLKLHFLCKHPYSPNLCAYFSKSLNDKWTHLSRELMRRSTEPTNIFDTFLGTIIVVVRSMYTHSSFVIFITFIILAIFWWKRKTFKN